MGDEKRVLKLSGKWFHSGKPLTSGTFEMYWDFTTRKMQGVRSEGNITTKWLWTGLDGALDWVSQIFHTDSVPMPKMLPDNFVYDLFVRHTFFDVFDPAFEDEKRSGHRVRSMSLPSTPVVRNDDGEVKADPIEPRELAVAVLDQPQERTRRKRGKRGQGRGKFAADKSVQVVGVLVSLGACQDSADTSTPRSFDTSADSTVSTASSVSDRMCESNRWPCDSDPLDLTDSDADDHMFSNQSNLCTEESEDASFEAVHDEVSNLSRSVCGTPHPQSQLETSRHSVRLVPQGKEQTVMIQNLPREFNNHCLCAVLFHLGFCGQFDFVYVPVDFNHCASYGFAFVNFLYSDQAEQFRRCFPQYARTCMPGCQRCHVRLNAPVQGLEDNIERYRNSPVMHEAVPAQYKPLLFDGGVPVAFPAPTKSIRFPRFRNFRRCQD